MHITGIMNGPLYAIHTCYVEESYYVMIWFAQRQQLVKINRFQTLTTFIYSFHLTLNEINTSISLHYSLLLTCFFVNLSHLQWKLALMVSRLFEPCNEGMKIHQGIDHEKSESRAVPIFLRQANSLQQKSNDSHMRINSIKKIRNHGNIPIDSHAWGIRLFLLSNYEPDQYNYSCIQLSE